MEILEKVKKFFEEVEVATKPVFIRADYCFCVLKKLN